MRLNILLTVVAVYLACGFGRVYADQTEPHVRLPAIRSSQLADHLKGVALVEELNCVACHKTESPLAASSKVAPRLAALGSRVNPYYVEKFIQSPHDVKPGTTMPDAMAHLPADQRQQAARAITHYLLSLKKSPAFDVQPIDAVAAELGGELFHTVGCVACHAPRNEQGEEILVATSVPLGALEKKYNTRSLAEFLRQPHRVRPSGRMPNLKLNSNEARQIAHYLLRKTQVPGHLQYTLLRGRVWEGLDVNVTKERAGQVDDFELSSLPNVPGNSAIIYEGYLEVEEAGEYTFFLEMNGGQLFLRSRMLIDLPPSSRRGVKTIQATAELNAGKNSIKFVYIHAGKEPKLSFTIEGPGITRQAIASSRLSISRTPIEAYQPYEIDTNLIAEGKRQFSELRCVQCHDDVPAEANPAPPLAKLEASRGCLGDSPENAPRFALSARQKSLIDDTLPQAESMTFDDEARVNKSLVTFNCLACHQRGELGGVAPERNQYFVGSKNELGNQGRIPPPLTHVGAKLQTSWIKEVLLNGQEQRDYLATRMPQFGEANVGHLVELFEKVDTLEEVAFDEIEDIEEVKSAGHQLIGATGFSCIACHDFNGQKASGPGAMDIIHSTERLKKDWFYLYLLNPARFHPDTVMPAAWPGGHAFKQDILGGDTKKQIESVWVYLKDGTRAKNPIGLSRKSPELRVTDVAIICRGRGNAGYRGIAVGYPQRISLAWDSEQMNLRLLWQGKFATAAPNRFSAIGDERITFPEGIPFHRLKTLDDNWPYKRKTDYLFPQDHGYQFRGYYLDKKQRPTFMYEFGDVRVEEFYEDLLDEQKKPYFRRTFTFDAPQAQEKFYFRAAAGGKVSASGSGGGAKTSFTADRLKVTIVSPHEGVIRDGEPQELLIPLEVPEGKSKLVLEYKW